MRWYPLECGRDLGEVTDIVYYCVGPAATSAGIQDGSVRATRLWGTGARQEGTEDEGEPSERDLAGRWNSR